MIEYLLRMLGLQTLPLRPPVQSMDQYPSGSRPDGDWPEGDAWGWTDDGPRRSR
jgi:hypothetical protein